MLRLIVLLLLLVNGVYYAWSQGLLKEFGFAPVQQSEPQRIPAQIRPEALRILAGDELRRTEAPAQASTAHASECLQTGPFDEVQVVALRQILEAALPIGAWRLDATVEPARWIVYMGKFPDVQAVAAKRVELTRLNLKLEPLTNPALEFGISLGAFETRGAAEVQLGTLKQRGVRTARVIEERPEVRGALLRITAAADVLKAHQDELKSALADKPWRACK